MDIELYGSHRTGIVGRQRRRRRERFAFAAVVLLIFVGAAGALALPAILRALPPRYLARLPEPVQALVREDAGALIPTPAIPVARQPLLIPATSVPRSPTARPPATARPQANGNSGEMSPTDAKPPAVATRTPEPTAVPPTATPPPPAPAYLLTGFRHNYQTWNNCGPATVTMNLSYYGWSGDQAQAAAFLKPDREDKNVSPDEMAAFARTVDGLQAIVRVNGTFDILKALIRAGIPAIVETGYDPEPDRLGWMGHYRLAVGYDDAQGHFLVLDTYRGAGDTGTGLPHEYGDFDKFWQHFNRTYIVVYRPDQAETVAAILGSDMDVAANYEGALARAQAETAANPQDAFAWFNIGSSLAGLGRYEEAATAYDQARIVGLPWRMSWYQFGPFEAYYHVGRYDDVLALVAANLKYGPYVEESFYYRGLVYQAQGNIAGARENYQAALRYNPNFQRASDALAALPPG
jgi:tetratricopeptide (TPR) repeat protein